MVSNTMSTAVINKYGIINNFNFYDKYLSTANICSNISCILFSHQSSQNFYSDIIYLYNNYILIIHPSSNLTQIYCQIFYYENVSKKITILNSETLLFSIEMLSDMISSEDVYIENVRIVNVEIESIEMIDNSIQPKVILCFITKTVEERDLFCVGYQISISISFNGWRSAYVENITDIMEVNMDDVDGNLLEIISFSEFSNISFEDKFILLWSSIFNNDSQQVYGQMYDVPDIGIHINDESEDEVLNVWLNKLFYSILAVLLSGVICLVAILCCYRMKHKQVMMEIGDESDDDVYEGDDHIQKIEIVHMVDEDGNEENDESEENDIAERLELHPNACESDTDSESIEN